jgi:hypothetical protein
MSRRPLGFELHFHSKAKASFTATYGRRARAAVAVSAEIGPALDSAFRHELLLHVAGVLRDRGGRSRDVEYDPVPETAAGWRVWVVDGNGEALGIARRGVPAQRRGNIPPLQPKTFATCASLMVAPSAISVLVSVMSFANWNAPVTVDSLQVGN